MGASRPRFVLQASPPEAPSITDFIDDITDRGGGIFVIATHEGQDLSSTDPALFTSPSAGAIGILLSNTPFGNSLLFDQPVAAGDTWDFAGSSTLLPGSGVIV